MVKNIKTVIIRHYSNGKYLPSYDKEFSYDLNDDKNYEEVHAEIGAYISRICIMNSNITVRVEEVCW